MTSNLVPHTAQEISNDLREMADKLPHKPIHLGTHQKLLRDAANALEALCSPDETSVCLWQRDDPDNEFFFNTACGQEGVDRETSWVFCPHCGKRLTTSVPASRSVSGETPSTVGVRVPPGPGGVLTPPVLTPEEPKSTQPPDSRGDAALWVLAWLAMKGGLGSDVHEVIEAVMEGRAEMRPNNKLHIEPRGAEKASECICPKRDTDDSIIYTHVACPTHALNGSANEGKS